MTEQSEPKPRLRLVRGGGESERAEVDPEDSDVHPVFLINWETIDLHSMGAQGEWGFDFRMPQDAEHRFGVRVRFRENPLESPRQAKPNDIYNPNNHEIEQVVLWPSRQDLDDSEEQVYLTEDQMDQDHLAEYGLTVRAILTTILQKLQKRP